MRLQMRRIDHQERWLATFARQFGKDIVEHAEPAPAHEPVIDRLVRTIAGRCIAPAQTVSDDEDDAADHPSIVNPRNPVRQRKTARSSASAPPTATTNQPWRCPLTSPLNQPASPLATDLTGPV